MSDLPMDLHHLILSHDEEKIQLKKENEKLKKEKEEYEAVEQFIMQCFRNNNFDEALHAHYREGKVIDGKWVNDNESDEESSD